MKRLIIATALALLMLGGCKQIQLPDIQINEDYNLADFNKGLEVGYKVYNAAKEITPPQEYYIGRSVAASILERYRLHDDPKLGRYLNSVGQILVLHSDQPEIYGGYHFAVLDSDEINAFASPGGFVFVTRGMLSLCQNEDELAAILAHEIAHVQKRHGISSIKQSRWTSVATLLAVEAAKRHDSEELAKLTTAFEDSIDDVVNTLVVNGYSRAFEKEADEYALTLLSRTGYTTTSMGTMLGRMGERLADDRRGFGSTHPLPSERYESIEGLIERPGKAIPAIRTDRFIQYRKHG